MSRTEFAKNLLKDEPWAPTPLLQAQAIGGALGIELWLKREDCTPVGSFKLRGALVAMERQGPGVPAAGVYVASAGNYGLAIATAGRRAGIGVTVFVAPGATPSKLNRIRMCGSRVVEQGNDFDAAKDAARSIAREDGAAFWEDGVITEMADGAATIASELLDHPEPWDAVVVPVGNGSLIKGVATEFKTRSPETRVVGLVSTGAPAMAHAIQGRPWDEHAPVDTIADGLAVRLPIMAIAEEIGPLVDDVWLVDESLLIPAVRTLMEMEQVMAEPSAAINIAGLAEHRAQMAGKRVAAIITGGHLSMSLLPEIGSSKGLFG